MSFEATEEEELRQIESIESDAVKEPPVTVNELELMCKGNEELEEALGSMLDYCYRYTITVAQFKRIALESEGTMTEALVEIDGLRRNVHNSTIDAINIFSRLLAQNKKDNTWMEEVVGDRTRYTRFALTLILEHMRRQHVLAK